MNKYIDLGRVEFLITNNCSSNCIHCSNYKTDHSRNVISQEVGKNILTKVSGEYSINSVMAFGGEPLLYPEETIGILEYAKELGIPTRQIITNAYWSKNKSKIDDICFALKKADVNDILISVDYFHNEHVDSGIFDYTISTLVKTKLTGIQLSPCWYESAEGDNQYDEKTRELLNVFSNSYNIEICTGDVLFPAGRAIENFPDRFKPISNVKEIYCGNLPYTERPDKIESICIDPEGFVDSLCTEKSMAIDDFLENYNPYADKTMKMFLEDGIETVVSYAKEQSIDFDISEYYSVCDACKDLRHKINKNMLR